MFAKMFRQIFESSIAENYQTRHTFMDLLVLADIDGVVDMTQEAISRITNVPIDTVCEALEELEAPDEQSRNPTQDGRRIVRLDAHRDWGWQIVNYEAYRQIRDEEARRAYFRERKRKQRAKEKQSQPVRDCQTLSNDVLDSQTCPPMQKKKEKEKEKEKAEYAACEEPDGSNGFDQYRQRYPRLNIEEEYQRSKAKLGREPPRKYFNKWLENAEKDLIPDAPKEETPKKKTYWADTHPANDPEIVARRAANLAKRNEHRENRRTES
jgi:hypothetical protein